MRALAAVAASLLLAAVLAVTVPVPTDAGRCAHGACKPPKPTATVPASTPTPSVSPSPSPSPAPSASPSPTVSPSPSASPSAVPSASPSPSATPTPTPTLPVTGYPADTVLRYIAHGVLPFPPLGVPVLDPTLGTTTTRISQNGQRHAYSRLQPWNADGSLLLLSYGSLLVDGTTYAPIRTLGTLPGYANWSPTDPDVLYGTWDGETSLFALNVRTDVLTSVHNFGMPVSLGNGEGAISDTARVALQSGTTIIVYDIPANAVVSTFAAGGTPDNVTMSHDGRYVLAYFQQGTTFDGTGPGKGLWVWDANGSNGRQLLTIARHGDTAIDQAGRQVWVQVSPHLTMSDLATGVTVQLAVPDPNAYVNGHLSGRATLRPGWALVSDYYGYGTQPGTDQVVAIKLDMSGVVEVFGFANHRASSYETQPQAVPSRDMKRALLASDYGTSGVYAFVMQEQ